MTAPHRFASQIEGAEGHDNLRVFSPFSGEEIGRVPLADDAAIDRAIAAAHAAAATPLPAHQRAAILRRTARQLEARRDELALLIAREGGKPLLDARVEVGRAASTLDLCADAATGQHGEEIPMRATAAATGRLAFTTFEPIGVVAAISAFNHPLNLIAHQAGPALAAGCPVLLKPAVETPLSCFTMVELLRAAGLPSGWAQTVMCDNDRTRALASRADIAYVSFIGSAKVGWSLRQGLAPGVRCGLEHGGVAPVIVDAGADLARFVPLLVKGAMYHAGQVCVSVQRVFVHQSLRAELVEALRESCARLVVGDPTDERTEVGPLIRAREVDRLVGVLAEAKATGGEIITGGNPLPGQCFQPTVVVEPGDDSGVMRDEVFGPIVSVCAFSDLDEAIGRANGPPFCFQAAIMTPSFDRAMHAVRTLKGATVLVNDHTAFRVDWMPFGGHERSGLGLGGVAQTVREMSRQKLVVLRG